MTNKDINKSMMTGSGRRGSMVTSQNRRGPIVPDFQEKISNCLRGKTSKMKFGSKQDRARQDLTEEICGTAESNIIDLVIGISYKNLNTIGEIIPKYEEKGIIEHQESEDSRKRIKRIEALM